MYRDKGGIPTGPRPGNPPSVSLAPVSGRVPIHYSNLSAGW